MRFEPLFEPTEEILRDYEYFMTAYQIGLEIQRRYPDVWQELISEYGEDAGSGAGTEYSWANHISRALDYCLEQGTITDLHKEYIATEGIQVEGISPGNEVVAIWRIS